MSIDPSIPLRLGTRGSALARSQSRLVAGALEKAHPGLTVELVIIRTSGDRIRNRPLYDEGGKGLFTRELEQALLSDRIDFAVHSFKDMPVTTPLVDQTELIVAAVPARENPLDVFISTRAGSLKDLPPGARVGTSSTRRRSQVLAQRADLEVVPLRGNIDLRLKKLDSGEYDAILLAAAGLKRTGLFDESRMSEIDPSILLPAPGQGALALQCRRGDDRLRRLLAAADDPVTSECVMVERAVVAALEGDCHSPIAAWCVCEGESLSLRVAVGGRDGVPPILRAQGHSPRNTPQDLVASILKSLLDQGVQEHLGIGR